MGYFKKEEFLNGLTSLGVHDLTSLRTKLASIEKETKYTTPAFTDLYKVNIICWQIIIFTLCTVCF